MKLPLPKRRTLITSAIAAACGAAVALAITLPPLISVSSENQQTQDKLTTSEQALRTAQAGEQKAKGQASAASRSAAQAVEDLASREAAVEAREQAVSSTEKQIKDSSFGGGIYVVGRDVAAGTYRTGELRDSCYYVWKTGTGADADIVDNNIVREGTATVTLADGEVFESNRCGTWTKVG